MQTITSIFYPQYSQLSFHEKNISSPRPPPASIKQMRLNKRKLDYHKENLVIRASSLKHFLFCFYFQTNRFSVEDSKVSEVSHEIYFKVSKSQKVFEVNIWMIDILSLNIFFFGWRGYLILARTQGVQWTWSLRSNIEF